MRVPMEQASREFVKGLNVKHIYPCYTITYGDELKIENGIMVSEGSNGNYVSIGTLRTPVSIETEPNIEYAGVKNSVTYGVFNLFPYSPEYTQFINKDYVLLKIVIVPRISKGYDWYGKITGDRKSLYNVGFNSLPGCIIISARVNEKSEIINGKKSSGVQALVLLPKNEVLRVTREHNVYYVGAAQDNTTPSVNITSMHLRLDTSFKADNSQIKDLKDSQIEMPQGYNPGVDVLGENSMFLIYKDGEMKYTSFFDRYNGDSSHFNQIPK